MTNEENEKKRAKRRGDAARAKDDHELVDQAGLETLTYERSVAIAELQRRSAERINESVQQFSQASDHHAKVMIVLTLAIFALTAVLVVLAVLASP